MPKFIGNQEISDVQADKEGFSKVSFDDGHTAVLSDALLDLIAGEEKGNGSVTDCVNDYFARKFIIELSEFALPFYFADRVGVCMATLAHNLREELFRKTFDGAGGHEISLKTLVSSATTTDSVVE